MAAAQEQAPNTRELILAAAEDLFASQGYQSTTIKQVAEQVGVQGPALYKHFANKRALFEEVLERVFDPFTSLMQDSRELPGTLQRVLEQQVKNPNASRIVQQATLSGGEDLALLVERWYLPFFEQAREAASSGDGGLSAVNIMALHSMLLGYLTLAPLHRAIFDTEPLSVEALAELLQLEMSFVGLLAPDSAE
ncbi:MAG: helix-turn-helix transcriptional regulator [Halioglobus sp.]|nr:helix-turn-helix transcriptional regulator [Halioglobus sp.]